MHLPSTTQNLIILQIQISIRLFCAFCVLSAFFSCAISLFFERLLFVIWLRESLFFSSSFFFFCALRFIQTLQTIENEQKRKKTTTRPNGIINATLIYLRRDWATVSVDLVEVAVVIELPSIENAENAEKHSHKRI